MTKSSMYGSQLSDSEYSIEVLRDAPKPIVDKYPSSSTCQRNFIPLLTSTPIHLNGVTTDVHIRAGSYVNNADTIFTTLPTGNNEQGKGKCKGEPKIPSETAGIRSAVSRARDKVTVSRVPNKGDMPRAAGNKGDVPRAAGNKGDVPRDKVRGNKVTVHRAAGNKSIVPRAAGNKGVVPRAAGNKGVVPRAAGNKGVVHRAAGNKSVVPRAAGNKSVVPRAAGNKVTVPRADGSKVHRVVGARDKVNVPRAAGNKGVLPRTAGNEGRTAGNKGGLPRAAGNKSENNDAGVSPFDCSDAFTSTNELLEFDEIGFQASANLQDLFSELNSTSTADNSKPTPHVPAYPSHPDPLITPLPPTHLQANRPHHTCTGLINKHAPADILTTRHPHHTVQIL